MKKKFLVVDDSALMRRLISDIIISDERFSIADIASNGLEAFDLVTLYPRKYDAILLDINMPKMNGIEFLEQLERLHIKQTVIIVSTLAKEGAKETIRCLELGAFDFVTKPESYIEAKNDSFKNRILTVLSVAVGLSIGGAKSEVVSVPAIGIAKSTMKDTIKGSIKETRPTESGQVSISTTRELQKLTARPVKKSDYVRTGIGSKKLVALACSTGGPKALQQVIPLLPENLDAPVVLVQHMPEGFTNSLAQRLNEMSKLKVKEAANGDIVTKGVVYIAKGGSQMRILRKGDGYQLSVTVEPARNGLKPCADIMYESLLDADYEDITCVVLTGMGGDGTLGIKQLNDKKNIYVIAQDRETSTVYGMPKVVAEAGLVNEVVPITMMASAITKNVGVR